MLLGVHHPRRTQRYRNMRLGVAYSDIALCDSESRPAICDSEPHTSTRYRCMIPLFVSRSLLDTALRTSSSKSRRPRPRESLRPSDRGSLGGLLSYCIGLDSEQRQDPAPSASAPTATYTSALGRHLAAVYLCLRLRAASARSDPYAPHALPSAQARHVTGPAPASGGLLRACLASGGLQHSDIALGPPPAPRLSRSRKATPPQPVRARPIGTPTVPRDTCSPSARADFPPPADGATTAVTARWRTAARASGALSGV